MKTSALIAAAAIALTGCATSPPVTVAVHYTPPVAPAPIVKTKIVDAPRDQVFGRAVASLSRFTQSFAMANKDAGLLMFVMKLKALPQAVDCGFIGTAESDGRSTKAERLPADYFVRMYRWPARDGQPIEVVRQFSTSAGANMVFEALPDGKTRVTANTYYSLIRKTEYRRYVTERFKVDVSTANFEANTGGSMDGWMDGAQTIECFANGALEKKLLDAII